jgi:hypothetical protein
MPTICPPPPFENRFGSNELPRRAASSNLPKVLSFGAIPLA